MTSSDATGFGCRFCFCQSAASRLSIWVASGKTAPWVTVALRGVATQVNYANLRATNFDVGDGGWIADFNDAKNYLYLLETRTGPQNYPGYNNPEFDRLVHDSDFEPNLEARAQLMSRAEQMVLNDAPI